MFTFVVFCWRSQWLAVIFGHVCAGWGTTSPRQGKNSIALCVRQTTRQLDSAQIAPFGSRLARQLSVIQRYYSYEKRDIYSSMKPALHETRAPSHGASFLQQAMPAWWVNTLRGLSRHAWDGVVYSLTMIPSHDIRTPLCPPLSCNRRSSSN